jgi:hypothetical protein
MTQEIITVEYILDWMKTIAENKQDVSPSKWIDMAGSLLSLQGELDDEYCILEQKTAKIQEEYMIQTEGNVSASKNKMKLSPAYLQYITLKAKIGRVKEFINIAKKKATISLEREKGW